MSNTVLVPEKIHRLPGLADFEYLYNRDLKELVINHEGHEIKRFTNGEALRIYTLVTDDEFRTMEQVLDRVCKFFKVEENDILSRTRKREVSDVRSVFAYYVRINMNLTYAEIGKFLFRDHATILNMVRNVNDVEEVKIMYENFNYFMSKKIQAGLVSGAGQHTS